jgi:hypothetical protein
VDQGSGRLSVERGSNHADAWRSRAIEGPSGWCPLCADPREIVCTIFDLTPNLHLIHTPYPPHPTLSPLRKIRPQNIPLDGLLRSMYNSLMDLTPYRQEIAKGLTALETASARLVDALSHGSFLAQIEAADDRNAVRKICEAYSTIDYKMDDDINSSPVCLGVICVNADTLKRAQAVNTAKAKFKALCTPLQGIRIRIPVKGESSPTKAIPAIRVILRNIQRSDLNLLAAYRKIPILDAPPKTVTYTRANTRAVYRKTIDEIADMLQNLNSPTSIADRERLSNLDRRVTHLALVKDRYPNIRANVLYSRLDTKGRGRIQIAAELPLMYATGRHHQPPEVHFPVETETENKPQRKRTSKLEPEPYLSALPVYRYR